MNKYHIKLQQKHLKSKENFCVDCGKSIYPGSKRCIQCEALSREKDITVSREELKKLIRNTPFVKIGEKFGVSDNTIRKWFEKYNLPKRVIDIKSIDDENWKKI